MYIDATPIGVFIENIHRYRCDTRADIESLPTQFTSPASCATGSEAFCISDSSMWMLNSSGQWIQTAKTAKIGDDSSGNIDEVYVASDDEVNEMLSEVFGTKDKSND